MAGKIQQRFLEISSRLVLILLLVTSLVLVTLYFREGDDGVIHKAQSTFSGMMLPFRFVSGAVGSGTDGLASAVEGASASEATLEALRAQNEQLRNELAKSEEYRQEAKRLEALLGIKDLYDLDTVAARVTNRSFNAWEQTITINKGERDGVIAGLPVMGSSGVIGLVISTRAASADVRLLADPQSGVSVLIESNRAEGVVWGSLEGLLYLKDVNADATVQVGDVVITSGLGGSYCRGLIVGTVVKVDASLPGSTRKIVVKPNAHTGSLEEVLVVLKMNSEGAAWVPPAPEDPEATDGQGYGGGE